MLDSTVKIFKDKKALLICITGMVILVVHSLYYLPFLSDDSLISLRYSQRLIQGLGLTWNNDIRVEGYSNLLWVLLSAFLGYIGIDLIDSVRILGFLCAFIIVSTPFLLFLRGVLTTHFALLISTLVLALCAPLAIWTVGGLEQPLVAALLCLSILFLLPYARISWITPGIFLAFISITRPDGILFAGCICLSIVILNGITVRSILLSTRIMMLPLLFFLAQLIFRYYYYEALVPNTALVKISFSMQRLISGIKYISIGIASFFPFSFLIPMIFVWTIKRKILPELITFIIITLLIWLSYLVFIGGDIFPGSRHFLPVIPLLAIAIGLGSDAVINNLKFSTSNFKIALIIFGLFGIYIPLQFLFPNNARAKEERWEWDGMAIAKMLKDEWHDEQPLFAITAAGCLPYWTEFPCIDMLGLNDYYIPRHPPKEFGKGYLGHDLGDANYVLSRKPDLISFCGPNGSIDPCFIADMQLKQKPEFIQKYVPAYFRTSDPLVTNAIIWLKKDSKSIGHKFSKDTISIRCWHLSNLKNPVMQDYKKSFILKVGPNDTLMINDIVLPEGLWNLKEMDHNTSFTIVQNQDGYKLNSSDKLIQIVSTGNEASNDISIIPTKNIDLKGIVFTKVKAAQK